MENRKLELICKICGEEFTVVIDNDDFDDIYDDTYIPNCCPDCQDEHFADSVATKMKLCDLCGEAIATGSDHYTDYCDDCYENTYGE